MLMYNETQEGLRLLELLCDALQFVPRMKSRTDDLADALDTLLKNSEQPKALSDEQKKKIREFVRQIKSRKPDPSGKKLKADDWTKLKAIALPGLSPDEATMESVMQRWHDVFDANALTNEQQKLYVEIALFCLERIHSGRYSINYRYAYDAERKPVQVLAQTLADMSLAEMQQRTDNIKKLIEERSLKLDDCLFSTYTAAGQQAVASQYSDDDLGDLSLNVFDDDDSFTGDLPEDEAGSSQPVSTETNGTLDEGEQDRIRYAVKILQLIPAMRSVLGLGYSLLVLLFSSKNASKDVFTLIREFANNQDEDRDILGEVKEQTLDVFDNDYSALSMLLTAMHQPATVSEGDVLKVPARWLAERHYSPETILLAAIVCRMAKKPNEYVAVPSGLESLGLYGNQEIHARSFYLAAQKNALTQIDRDKLYAVQMPDDTVQEASETDAYADLPGQPDTTGGAAMEDDSDYEAQQLLCNAQNVAPDALLMFTSINKVAMVKLTELGYTQIRAAADAADELIARSVSFDGKALTDADEMQEASIGDLLEAIKTCQPPKTMSFDDYKRNSCIAMKDEGGNELYQIMRSQPKVREQEKLKADCRSFILFDHFGMNVETDDQIQDKLKLLKTAIKDHCFRSKDLKSLVDVLKSKSELPINAAMLNDVIKGPKSFDAKVEVNNWLNNTVRPFCMALLCCRNNGVVLACKENDLVDKLCSMVDQLTVQQVKEFVEEISARKEGVATDRVWLYDFFVGKDRAKDEAVTYVQIKGTGQKEKGLCLRSGWRWPHTNTDDADPNKADPNKAVAMELLHTMLHTNAQDEKSTEKFVYADRLWWPIYQQNPNKWQKGKKMVKAKMRLDYQLILTPDQTNPSHPVKLDVKWIEINKSTTDDAAVVAELNDETRKNSIQESVNQVDELRKNSVPEQMKEYKKCHDTFEKDINRGTYVLSAGVTRYSIDSVDGRKQITMYPYFTSDTQAVTFVGSLCISKPTKSAQKKQR